MAIHPRSIPALPIMSCISHTLAHRWLKVPGSWPVPAQHAQPVAAPLRRKQPAATETGPVAGLLARRQRGAFGPPHVAQCDVVVVPVRFPCGFVSASKPTGPLFSPRYFVICRHVKPAALDTIDRLFLLYARSDMVMDGSSPI
jgi:hypothetical protein